MKIALLGGSFNPVHMGHLYLADAVLSELDYQRVILIPAFQSPLKTGHEGASPQDRLDMLRLSILGDPRICIDDCEIRRAGLSYTIDTIKDIIARYRPEGKPGLILGDDLLESFTQWKSHEEIAGLADLIIARRLASGTAELGVFPYPHRALNNEIINLSSREVREKIPAGQAWQYLVPPGARHIILDRSLYGAAPRNPEDEHRGVSLENIIKIENDLRSMVDAYRFTHSRNTALLAWDLCRLYGLDSLKGYLAGIAHDLCKTMKAEELVRLARRDGRSISRLEQDKPGLLHARAAAVLIQEKYGIRDIDIIEAVSHHTTGARNMCPLAKVIYIADKLEMSRPGIDPVLRETSLKLDLDTLFAIVLDDTVTHLRSQQKDLSYGTRRLLAAMNRKNGL
ncbi:MAG: nicotinate (nicotinamide) nucleotide adenylyltransferase [Treponema sp.]|nr:nicotinate (nicotinamide) nucleotide adenylyltransferase [Treponema sp.]